MPRDSRRASSLSIALSIALSVSVSGCSSSSSDNAGPADTSTPVACTKKASSTVGTTCVFDWTGCTDGKRYELLCDTAYCACTVDAKPSGHTSAACPGEPDTAKMNAECGWNLK